MNCPKHNLVESIVDNSSNHFHKYTTKIKMNTHIGRMHSRRKTRTHSIAVLLRIVQFDHRKFHTDSNGNCGSPHSDVSGRMAFLWNFCVIRVCEIANWRTRPNRKRPQTTLKSPCPALLTLDYLRKLNTNTRIIVKWFTHIVDISYQRIKLLSDVKMIKKIINKNQHNRIVCTNNVILISHRVSIMTYITVLHS